MKEMYDAVAAGRLLEISSDPSAEKYATDIGKLVSWGLEHGRIEGCEGFVLEASAFVKGLSGSLDGLAADYMETAEGTSQSEKLAWLRTFMKSALEGHGGDLMSFHEWHITAGFADFMICAVIAIEGHGPEAVDYFATKRASEINPELRARGYLITAEHVDDLTDEQLSALWD